MDTAGNASADLDVVTLVLGYLDYDSCKVAADDGSLGGDVLYVLPVGGVLRSAKGFWLLGCLWELRDTQQAGSSATSKRYSNLPGQHSRL